MTEYLDEKAGIYLRPMTYDDTELIVKWRNHEAVRRNFVYQELFTKEGHENWIRTMIETGKAVQMIICETGTDKPVGSVYMRDIDRQHSKAEYGIFIGEDCARGRGYGTAAARLMIRYAFEQEKLHKLFLRAYADNTAAIRSYEKAGFTVEAYLREDVYTKGAFRDMVLMAVLNKESQRRA